MRARLWRIPGLIVLWNLTVAAPNCDGSGVRDAPRCGEVSCTAAQYCTEDLRCAPRLGAGASCSRSQCAEALRCELGLVSPICVVPGEVSAGGECREREDCADALVCYPGGLCQPPLLEGDDCDRSPSICAPALRCRVVEGGPDRCLPPAREGEACARYGACEDGLICSFGVGDRTCIVARGVGEGCQIHNDCGEDLFCAETGESGNQCAWAGEPGDACDVEALALCVDRLVCDDGACRLANEDEFCWKDEDCRADLECSPYDFNADSYCIPRQP